MPSSLNVLQPRAVNNMISIDHSGRSLSPLPNHPGSNCLPLSRCCSAERSSESESFRSLSTNSPKEKIEIKELIDVDRLLSSDISRKLSSFSTDTDEAKRSLRKNILSVESRTSSRQSSSPDETVYQKDRKKSLENSATKSAAKPVSCRSIPIVPETTSESVFMSPISKSMMTASPIVSPLQSSLNIPEWNRPMIDSPIGGSVRPISLSTPHSTPHSTPVSLSGLRIETTPSSGTPGKKVAAAPVSVRSTNRPPVFPTAEAEVPKYNAIPSFGGTPSYGATPQYGATPEFGSNNSSPRSLPATPRHSNIIILGSSSKAKIQAGSSLSLEGGDTPPRKDTILQSLTRGKDAFFGRHRAETSPTIPYHLNGSGDSEHSECGSLSSYGGSGSFTTSPKSAPIRSPLPGAMTLKSMWASPDTSKTAAPVSPITPVTSKSKSSDDDHIKDRKDNKDNKKDSKDIKESPPPVRSNILAPLTETEFKRPLMPALTSVSSLWAFATEFSSGDEKPTIHESEIDKIVTKPTKRMSAEAISSAIARHTKASSSFPSPTTVTTLGKMTSANLLRVSAEDFKSEAISPTRRRSSAPTISDAMSESSDDPSCPSPPKKGSLSKRIPKQKMAERAVSLPTISSEVRGINKSHNPTFISSLWDLSADYSDHEKDMEAARANSPNAKKGYKGGRRSMN